MTTQPPSSNAPEQAATPVRFNETLLSAHERRLLIAIARRLPSFVTPNQLTILGIVGALIVVMGYAASELATGWLWLANLGLVIHWLGDSMDGTVARFRKIERPKYGFYLDQVIDALGNLLIALGVGMASWIRMDLALIVLALYQMLSIQVYVRAIVDREFHLAVGRLGPTEMRLGIFGLNCVVLLLGEPQPIPAIGGACWSDVLILLLSIGLLAMYGMQMKRHLTRFAVEDPPHRN